MSTNPITPEKQKKLNFEKIVVDFQVEAQQLQEQTLANIQKYVSEYKQLAETTPIDTIIREKFILPYLRTLAILRPTQKFDPQDEQLLEKTYRKYMDNFNVVLYAALQGYKKTDPAQAEMIDQLIKNLKIEPKTSKMTPKTEPTMQKSYMPWS